MNQYADLIERCLLGDAAAIEGFINTFQRELYQLAYALLRDPSAAENTLHRTITSALQNLDRYQAATLETALPFEHWLASLVVREAQRVQIQRRWLGAFLKQKPHATPPHSGAFDPRLWPAFLRLNASQQNLLVLRYHREYSSAEIARILNKSHNYIKSRLRKAREWLQDILGSARPPQDSTQIGPIGHWQARLFIQSSVDDPLNSDEWLALQAHLDGCPTCAAYQRDLQTLERDLQRALQLNLQAPAIPATIQVESIIQQHHHIRQVRRRLMYGGMGVLAALAIFSINYLFSPQPNDSIQVTPTPEPSPTPLPIEAGDFTSPVLFETRRDGNREIYLLEAGGQPVNLTNDPGEDFSPAWSPDGEWIAFLSDRTGKAEIYTMHVTGTRLTRLTTEPDIHWQGPLSWSPYGTDLLIAGQWARDDHTTWIYRVPVDGRGAARLGFTRDALHPRWSAEPGWLAFEQPVEDGMGLIARKIDELDGYQIVGKESITGEVFLTNDPRDRSSISPSSYDWSPNNQGLLYVANGPYQVIGRRSDLRNDHFARSQVHVEEGFPNQREDGARIVNDFPMNSKVISVSWSPADILAFLQVERENPDCLRLYLQLLGNGYRVPGLCVTAPLTDSPWTPDGAWLVINGMRDGEDNPALYALNVEYFWDQQVRSYSAPPLRPTMTLMPTHEASGFVETFTGAVHLVRLTEPGLGDILPQVPPRAPRLDIEPKQAEYFHEQVLNTTADNVGGRLIFSEESSGNSEIFAMRPDGSERTNLTQHPADDSQPIVSPDQTLIAFVSSRLQDSPSPSEEIFVMGMDGSNPRQVTASSSPIRYSDLTWSPDGKWLSAVARSPGDYFLVLIDPTEYVGEGLRLKFVPLMAENYLPPVWTLDSKRILVAQNSSPILSGEAQSPPRIMVLDVENGSLLEPLTAIYDWDRVEAIKVLRNDNPYQADQLLMVVSETRLGNTTAELVRIMLTDDAVWFSPDTWQTLHTFRVSPGVLKPVEILAAQGSDQVLVRFHRPVTERFKSYYELVSLVGEGPSTLIGIEDMVVREWLSPDGEWLIYSSDSGVWLRGLGLPNPRDYYPAKILDDYRIYADWISEE